MLQKFFERCYKFENTKKGHIRTSLTPLSQNQNFCESLVAFKEQSGEILLGVNTSIMKETI